MNKQDRTIRWYTTEKEGDDKEYLAWQGPGLYSKKRVFPEDANPHILTYWVENEEHVKLIGFSTPVWLHKPYGEKEDDHEY